jgi:purine-nucleoside phosphorylase
MRPETHHFLVQIEEAAACIARHVKEPERTVAVVLGSGLGAFAEQLPGARAIPYADIPHFPQSHVPGHAGRLVFGSVEGRPVVLQQGRVHLYEGWSPWEVTLPVRVLTALGVRTLIITNAAGGLNPDFHPGDLMLIRDHLNLTGHNPLAGDNLPDFGPRFPDMSEAYPQAMRQVAREVAASLGLGVCEGIYAGLLGPSYETPAEIRMLRTLGADAVGMSTVSEVIAAVHGGLRVLGVSCITNLAAGISATPLSHAEVTETGQRVARDFVRFLGAVVPRL